MLDDLGLIGVTWRQGGAQSLTEFTLDETTAGERLREFARAMQLRELGYLATCNRVELIFARSDATPSNDLRQQAFEFLRGRAPLAGEAERRLKAWHGEGAAEHLFLVAAGLDSACVGETEIVGQVRRSYERTLELGLSGPALGLVFEEAQRIAARVRGQTRVGEGRVSLAEIAAQMMLERADDNATIALIGVSPMTQRAARTIVDSACTLLFVNRTAAKAERLADEHHGRHMSLEAFAQNPPPVAAILSATGSDRPVLDAAILRRIVDNAGGRAPLIVDMAVPPDVDADACSALGITRIGMDAINAQAESNRAARLIESAQAREQVDEALAKLHDRFAERYYGPLLGALQHRFQRTAREGIERLLKKELKGLGDDERSAIETWCDVLARRFAHIPCLGLRGLVHRGPDGSVEAFLSGLEPEFADELRSALGTNDAASRIRRAQ